MTGPIAVFVGSPGVGKTTIGEAVSAVLGVPFNDVDATIEARTGRPIADLFVDEGEEAFRALEHVVVAEALESFDGVVALGGGAILHADTRELLKSHTVIHLTVEFATALKRIGITTHRPLLAINPRATLRYLLSQRLPLYASVATHTVSTEGKEPAEIAVEVAALLKGPAGAPGER